MTVAGTVAKDGNLLDDRARKEDAEISLLYKC